ncbi:MAG: hypothetical protein ACOYMV_13110, partial [Verrucomicrobiia bacterium]
SHDSPHKEVRMTEQERVYIKSAETRRRMSEAKLGRRHWRAVVPDVGRILELKAGGLSEEKIAGELGLSRAVVGGVIRGTHWSVRKVEGVAR